MKFKQVASMKINRRYWQMIQDGSKQWELRKADEFDNHGIPDVFLFSDSKTHEYLGVVSIGQFTRFNSMEWSFKKLERLTNVPEKELRSMFSPNDDIYCFEVKPINPGYLIDELRK